jgi:hypothetical protein
MNAGCSANPIHDVDGLLFGVRHVCLIGPRHATTKLNTDVLRPAVCLRDGGENMEPDLSPSSVATIQRLQTSRNIICKLSGQITDEDGSVLIGSYHAGGKPTATKKL